MVKFSRRTESQLSRWAKRYASKNAEELLDEGKRSGRYMAVNLENSHTVEFRLFRGTLNANTLFATLELVDLLVNSSVEIPLNNLYQLTLNELIASNSEYTYLAEYCKKRDIIIAA
jgi:hypothetical protein